MTEIIPAVLPKSLEELRDALARLQGVTQFVQIDFVSKNVLAGEESIPLWEDFEFEADIMLANPSNEVRHMIELGASRIVVHADAPDAHDALTMLQETREGEFKVEVGIALGAHDSPEVLERFTGLYDYVQVMGINHVGKQGEPFEPKAIELVERVRAIYPMLMIQVDGAAATHPRELAKAGANRLIVGSAILTADNPKAEIDRLYTKVNVGS